MSGFDHKGGSWCLMEGVGMSEVKMVEVDRETLTRRAVEAMKDAITNIVRDQVVYGFGEASFEIWSIQPDRSIVIISLRTTRKFPTSTLEKVTLGYFIKANRFYHRNVEHAYFMHLLEQGYLEVCGVEVCKIVRVEWLVVRSDG